MIKLSNKTTITLTKKDLNLFKLGLESLIRETETKLKKEQSEKVKNVYENMIQNFNENITKLKKIIWGD